MFFYVAALIIPLACTVITIKTLVGYSSLKPLSKVIVSLLIAVSWFAPAIIGLLRMLIQTDSTEFNIISYVGFTMFGFVFILFSLLLVRDIVWYAIYGVSRLINMDIWAINPKNISVLPVMPCMKVPKRRRSKRLRFIRRWLNVRLGLFS